MKTVVNEKRILKLIPNFFKEPSVVLVEVAQNAQRAGATKLDVAYKDGLLTVKDNGHGTDEVAPLLVLAESDWSAEVEASHNPAGWGLYCLYAVSLVVTFQSKFGKLTLDCQSFLTDEKYRENIEKMVDKEEACKGFRLTAVIREDAAGDILRGYAKELPFFPLDITVNGEQIERKTIESEYRDKAIKTSYQGNDVFINPFVPQYESFPVNEKDFAEHLDVIWYGIFIDGKYSSKQAVIDVKANTPLTPVLPYRQDIQLDDKFKKFYEFVKGKTVEYCIKYINSKKINDDDRKLLAAMKTMSDIAAQGELDQLTRFYVYKDEPHIHNNAHDSRRGESIVKVDEKIVSESLFAHVDYGDGFLKEEDESLLHLPEGTIVEMRAPKRHPSWLKIEEKRYTAYVVAEKVHRGYFTWYKSSVRCDGKNISVLAAVNGYSDGAVFYTKRPGDFYDITWSVFHGAIYSEDSDTYDTQQYEYEKEIDHDIAVLTDTFRLYALFGALADAAGFSTDDISSVTVDRRRRTVTIVGKKKAQKKVVKF